MTVLQFPQTEKSVYTVVFEQDHKGKRGFKVKSIKGEPPTMDDLLFDLEMVRIQLEGESRKLKD